MLRDERGGRLGELLVVLDYAEVLRRGERK
jgi:hypothetical protein